MQTLTVNNQTLSLRLKNGAQDSWFLLRSPAALWLGLKQKWMVPALLVLSLLLVPVVLLPSVNFLLEKLYPPVEKSQLFGLINTSHEDERLATRKTQAAVALWLLAVAAVTGGLICYAPEVRRAAVAGPLARGEEGQGRILQFGSAGRYRVLEELGSGAMGVVYAALDTKLEREVALKVLPAVFVGDSERRERFRREALTLAQLTHPGIVQVYDLLDEGERLVLVLELVRGGTLEELIARRAPLDAAEAGRLIAEICAALEHVQRKGIVHRDLKPANILLDEQGGPKVTDFGMARLLRESGMTLEGSVIGTPRYMSPEQAAGRESDYRSDIYALGTIFYELLSGETPFSGEAAAVLLQQVGEEPQPLAQRAPEADSRATELVAAMLAKDPWQRPEDFSVIQTRLRQLTG